MQLTKTMCWLLLVMLLSCLPGQQPLAQEKGPAMASISGFVKNDSGEPLANISVMLLAVKDSTMASGAVSDRNGYYYVKVSRFGSYFLRFSGMGHVQLSTPFFTLTEAVPNQQHATVVLESVTTNLKEVVVKTRKPLVQNIDDKLVFNVDSDPSLEKMMATDALRKTPFIIVDGEGNIKMAGKKNLKILLNGKSTGLMAVSPATVLKTFPANLIKRIEVITDPSAKYDAEGTGGVINIVTKNGIQGYRITVNAGAGTNFDETVNKSWSTNFAVKIGKFGVNGYWNSGWTDTKNVMGATTYQSRISGAPFDRRETTGSRDYQSSSDQGDFELSWDLDSLSSIAGYGTVRRSGESSSNRKDLLLYDRNNALLDKGKWNDYTTANAPRSNWGLDYTKKFKKNPNAEFSISWNMQQTISKNSSDNSQDNQAIPDRFVINNNDFRNIQQILQSDLTLPLTGRQTVEVGIKGILRNASSDYVSLVRDPSTNKFIVDPANSNRFDFNQNVWGVYSTYRFWLGKLRFIPGVRVENTQLAGQFKTTGTAVQQNYTSLFPGITIRRNFAKNNQSVSISYGRHLARPDISYLNPFVNNNDPLFIRYGNPLLKPEFSNEVSMSYSYSTSQFTFNATLRHEITSGEILAYSMLNPATGVTTTTYDNLGKTNTSSLSAFIRLRVGKKLIFNTPMSVYYVNINGKLPADVSNHGWGATGNINMSYNFSSSWALYYASSLQVPNITLQGRPASRYHYNITSFHRIFKGKLGLNLTATNLFAKNRLVKQTLKTPAFSQVSNEYEPARSFSISILYSISKLKENVSRKKGVSTDDLKR